MARKPSETETDGQPLRRGWTTGACATAATKAALIALFDGSFPDPVQITLPKGEAPAFPLALEDIGDGFARAGIVKDAGDDPDVTHGATVISTVRPGPLGQGVRFLAGPGVGTVTREGLPILPGEPAINPVPRRMIGDVVEAVCAEHGRTPDINVEISIPGGEQLAEKTWNPRLGIVGGLSILGTTGIVHPFSCAAWIHSIHRGIDVARADGLERIAGSTGSTSENTVQALYDLPDYAMIDMGDFAGGMLKYLRKHPVPNVTIGGGFGKLTKLAQGALDLHSGRSQVDHDWLAERMAEIGASPDLAERTRTANTAAEVLLLAHTAGLPLADTIARLARDTAQAALRGAPVAVDIVVVARDGAILARWPDA
ncbi:MAG: cobalt-precorrin-5B (C(1))-methyltransferase [Pseudomonadota bacterium]